MWKTIRAGTSKACMFVAIGTVVRVSLTGLVFAMLGSFGMQAHAAAVYWNLFNIEGESSQNSIYITYSTLGDMLTDSNRTGNFTPDTSGGAAQNVVGSGSALLVLPNTVPEPGMLALMIAGLCALSHVTHRRRRYLC